MQYPSLYIEYNNALSPVICIYNKSYNHRHINSATTISIQYTHYIEDRNTMMTNKKTLSVEKGF